MTVLTRHLPRAHFGPFVFAFSQLTAANEITALEASGVGLIRGGTPADEGYAAPTWSMGTMNTIFGAFALLGLARVGREQSGLRGGGGELPRWLRTPTVRRPSEPEGAR